MVKMATKKSKTRVSQESQQGVSIVRNVCGRPRPRAQEIKNGVPKTIKKTIYSQLRLRGSVSAGMT